MQVNGDDKHAIRFYSRREIQQTARGWKEIMPTIHHETAVRLGNIEGTDCKPGCAHCCKLQVTVLPHEAMDVVEFVKYDAGFPRAQRDQIFARLEAAAKATEGLDAHQYRALDMACPFLDPDMNLCLVYSVRPMSCRAFGSMNVHVCDLSVPDDGRSTFRVIPDSWMRLLATSGLLFTPFLKACLDWWKGDGISAPNEHGEAEAIADVQRLIEQGMVRRSKEEPPFRKQSEGLNGHDHGL